MTELIELRNALMAELNAGYFDLLSWQACAIMARELGCDCIAAQVERYIRRYEVRG